MKKHDNDHSIGHTSQPVPKGWGYARTAKYGALRHAGGMAIRVLLHALFSLAVDVLSV